MVIVRLFCLPVMLALLLLCGCIFDVRDPEPPTMQAISYLPRSSPANIWENCRLALNNRDTGGWDAAVSASFVYEPDSEAEQAYDIDWSQWGKDQEMAFINSWFATGVLIQANLRDGGDDDHTPDGAGGVAEWTITYLLTVEDQTGRMTRYRAKAILEFKLEGSYYFLSSWRDEQGEVDPETGATLQTMGMLRGVFGS